VPRESAISLPPWSVQQLKRSMMLEDVISISGQIVSGYIAVLRMRMGVT